MQERKDYFHLCGMKKLRPREVDRLAQSHAFIPPQHHVGWTTPSLMQTYAPYEPTCEYGRVPPCPGRLHLLKSLGWSWHPTEHMAICLLEALAPGSVPQGC